MILFRLRKPVPAFTRPAPPNTPEASVSRAFEVVRKLPDAQRYNLRDVEELGDDTARELIADHIADLLHLAERCHVNPDVVLDDARHYLTEEHDR